MKTLLRDALLKNEAKKDFWTKEELLEADFGLISQESMGKGLEHLYNGGSFWRSQTEFNQEERSRIYKEAVYYQLREDGIIDESAEQELFETIKKIAEEKGQHYCNSSFHEGGGGLGGDTSTESHRYVYELSPLVFSYSFSQYGDGSDRREYVSIIKKISRWGEKNIFGGTFKHDEYRFDIKENVDADILLIILNAQ